MKFQWSDLEGIQLEGIDTADYPDFADAFVSYAYSISQDRELTDVELDSLTYDFASEINQMVHEQ